MANSPPPAFADFQFSFDPAFSNLFPTPPSLPSSADLFSPSETTDLFGFLDNFGWEFEVDPPHDEHFQTKPLTPYTNPHLKMSPEPSTSMRQKPVTRSSTLRATAHEQSPVNSKAKEARHRTTSRSIRSSSSSSTTIPPSVSDESTSASGATTPTPRAKPLLSTPQKRLNHIMSEQKRRNAIRDGYAELIALLAPAGAPALGMPTRGRPKGSGSRGKGQSKGKSGVLFRAVEYCRWLEEGRDALKAEVQRVESAAGIRY